VGLMMSFACPGCGYATGTLLLGPGPHPAEFEPRLVSCAACKTLRVIDDKKVERGCGKHRKPFALLDEEGPVPCPRCGERLAATPVGLWD
jgi:DNA-directed RNA polymerase subunit RPC12/RpoP